MIRDWAKTKCQNESITHKTKIENLIGKYKFIRMFSFSDMILNFIDRYHVNTNVRKNQLIILKINYNLLFKLVMLTAKQNYLHQT